MIPPLFEQLCHFCLEHCTAVCLTLPLFVSTWTVVAIVNSIERNIFRSAVISASGVIPLRWILSAVAGWNARAGRGFFFMAVGIYCHIIFQQGCTHIRCHQL